MLKATRKAAIWGSVLVVVFGVVIAVKWVDRTPSDPRLPNMGFVAVSDLHDKQLRRDYQRAYERYKAKDYESAGRLLFPLARAGVVEARYLIGRMYAVGDGVEKDLSEAERWISGVVRFYRIGAERGDVNAQYQLGSIYLDTLGVDRSEAYEWTAKAALRGHPGAQYNLSKLYFSRKGQPLPNEAVYWLRTAAESGNTEAQYDLGFRLARGQGIEKDSEQARLWLERAANAGHTEALNALKVFQLSAKTTK